MSGGIVFVGKPPSGLVFQSKTGPQGASGPAVSVGTPGQFFVTNAAGTATAWATVSGDVSASVVTVGQLTVTGLRGRTVSAAAPSVGNALVWGGASWAPGAIGPSSFTAGTAGQVLITNGTPATTWTSLISVEVTHGRFTAGGTGTDYKAVIGPLVGFETTYAALWLLPNATAPSVVNQSLYTDGTHLNISVAATNKFQFLSGASTVMASIDSTNGVGKFGGNGTDYYVAMGPDAATPTEGCVWILPGGTARSGTNMSLLYNGTATYLNTPGTYLSFTTSSFAVNLAWMQQSGVFLLWGLPTFTWVEAAGSPLLQHNARTSDAAPGDFTIRAQYAFATAAGANRVPGSIVHDIGIPTNGGTAEGYHKFSRNAVVLAQIGTLSGATTYGHLWLGTAAASSTNWALRSDAAGSTYLNSETGTAVGLITGGSTFQLYISGSIGYFGGSTGAAPIALDWTTAATPKLQGGTATTSFTVGTNKANATLVLTADANTTVLTYSVSAGNVIAQVPTGASAFQFNWAAAAGGGAATSFAGQDAAGTNDGGSFSVKGGQHSGAGTVEGSVKVLTPLNPGYVTAVAAAPLNLSNAQSDANVLVITGAPAGAFTVNVIRRIADTSLMVIRNNSSQVATIAYLTGGTVNIAAGTSSVICSDGANLIKVVIGT